MNKILRFFISIYQICFSSFFGPCCRFYPSCSSYAKDAIEKKGSIHGGWLALKRIFKCHPLCDGGYDPVT